ncbi:MAG: geranylgeranyl reductase family protein [Acidobacterium ailaaui]|nr:geranylgeranyl reductase family protein [Pseudacidobacterium ailaaui]
MKEWDAIVVGAGPAGCACAYDLAIRGRSVLLLDRAVFPRRKACAGGLTVKTLRALRYPVSPVVRCNVQKIHLERPGYAPMVVRSGNTICVMTVREELDAYCLRKTLEAGASLQKIHSIQRIVRDARGVSVVTPEGEWRGRFLIGADGANSTVRRLIGDTGWFRRGFALEAHVVTGEQDTGLVFDFSPVENGYGWVFPKGDHLNIGLYAAGPVLGMGRSKLADYIAGRSGAGAKAADFSGQHLGFGAAGHSPAEDRVFLVGDAGGFADPLTGEGIYGAVVSGQAAASAVLSALEHGVDAKESFVALTAKLRANLGLAERLAASFYRQPENGLRAMRLPLVRSAVLRSYAEGFNLFRITKMVRRVFPFIAGERG